MPESFIATKLRVLLMMSRAEVVSRVHAWEEVQSAGAEVLQELSKAGSKQSSPDMSSLAASVLAGKHDMKKAEDRRFILDAALSLAGCVLAQDEVKGDPRQLDLPKEDEQAAGQRGLLDAQKTGQALPLVRTVTVDNPLTKDEIEFIRGCEIYAAETRRKGESVDDYLKRLQRDYS